MGIRYDRYDEAWTSERSTHRGSFKGNTRMINLVAPVDSEARNRLR